MYNQEKIWSLGIIFAVDLAYKRKLRLLFPNKIKIK